MIDVGDLYPITVETRLEQTAQQVEDNEPGDLVDVTSVTITVTGPDGVSLTPVLATRTSLGTYDYDFPTTVPGLHQWTGISVGVVEGAFADTFVVQPAGLASIVGVDEVVRLMRADSTMDANDRDLMRDLCVAATSAVENDLHRALVRRVVVETHDGGQPYVFLRQTPVIEVTAVGETGTVLAGTGEYVIDKRSGILYRGQQQSVAYFDWGVQNIEVTYVAGVEQPPEFVRKVAKNTVIKMWQASQQLPHPYLDGQYDGAAAVQQATAQLTGPEYRSYEAYRMLPA